MPEIIRTWENHEYLKTEDSITHTHTNHDEEDDILNWTASDSVTFFRSLFKEFTQTGDRKSIPNTQFMTDPITGDILIEVQLRKIMPSNARPYLIDCYTMDQGSTSNHPYRSSTMLLKQGQNSIFISS